jgi:hypothetical protein
MRNQPNARWYIAVATILLAAALAHPASAQQTYSLSLNTQTVTITAPTATDYASGFTVATQSITYTVSGLSLTGVAHTVQVKIKSASATLGGGKAIADLQWQLNGTGAWTSMTASDALVQSYSMSRTNASFTGIIRFRVVLRWASDPPATYTATVNISITV